MLSVSNPLCGHRAGNERLRYGHATPRPHADAPRTVAVWAVTKACNLRCVHCYASADARPAPGELTYDEGLRLLDDPRASLNLRLDGVTLVPAIGKPFDVLAEGPLV